MSNQHVKAAYAQFDPAHLLDGLFIPTQGKKRGKLLIKPRSFKHLEIGFQGFEQLGVDDQSFLLALSAQLGITGAQEVTDRVPETDQNQKLRNKMKIKDDTVTIASISTSLRSLLADAGYSPNKSTAKVKKSLNRLRNAQVREINRQTGLDTVCNLISTSYCHKTEKTYIAANPRLTSAIFHGQFIQVSLHERNKLETEVAKLIHCWLCSNIRLGKKLGNGNGARLDTLAPHVWGENWHAFTPTNKSNKRSLLREALDEIADLTKGLQNGNGSGWVIDRTSSDLVSVSRPKKLPIFEQAT